MKHCWTTPAVYALGVSLAVIPLPIQSQTPRSDALSEISSMVERLARRSSPAVVQISVHGRAPVETGEERHAGFLAKQHSTGSGVIVDPDGFIVTNAHVVEAAQTIDVSVLDPARAGEIDDHRHYRAKVVGRDRETDLAVLRIEAKTLPTLQFLDSEQLQQGQMVIALGSPLGLDNSLTVGYVSAPVRHLRADQPMFYVQTDAAINPGNSGGPLLDSSGRIAGINTMILSQSGGSEGIGFAIPSNMVKRVYQQIRKEGKVRRGVIGVVPQEITPVLAAALGLEHHSGVLLSDVMPHGAAEAAGVEPGDVVVGVDGKVTRQVRHLTTAIFQHSIGDELKLDILRGGQPVQKVVAIIEEPDSPTGLGELASEDPHIVRSLGILALTVDSRVLAVLTNLRRLSGVAVAAIPAEFAALNPGLAASDVIYSVNGKNVNSIEELEAALAGKKPGDPVALYVEREGHLIYVSFAID